METPAAQVTPTTLLVGFLGAGKTTLVNRILSERHGERIAVVVNEFGDVGIDGSLVVSSAEEIVQLANGCVCCTVRGDLQRSLHDLLRARDRWLGRRHFDRLLIEASGLAAPGPIAQTLSVDPELAARLRLDGILAVAHARNLPKQLVQHPEAWQQIAYADRILIGHADRVNADELAKLERQLRELNPLAQQVVASFARVPVGPLLAIGTTRDRDWDLAQATSEHAHDTDIGCVALHSAVPLDLDRLKIWLQFLANRRSHDLYRIKGILRCAGRTERVVVQGMYEWLELGPSTEPAPAESVLLILGKDLDREELKRGWTVCQVKA